MISLRIPVDVLEKLKKIAPAKGMSGYQALIKYYVGKEVLELVGQTESAEKLENTLAKMGLKADQIDEVWKALGGCVLVKPTQNHDETSRSMRQE
jgi:hypothetical protein